MATAEVQTERYDILVDAERTGREGEWQVIEQRMSQPCEVTVRYSQVSSERAGSTKEKLFPAEVF